MDQSLFKAAHHDPNKLVTGIESNLEVLQKNVGNVDKVWLSLQNGKTLNNDSLYPRFYVATRLTYK